MPASQRSLSVTSAYRDRVRALRQRVQAQAEREWPTIEGLDGTAWPGRMALVVGGAQTEAVRAAAGYLSAMLSSELGVRQRAITIDSRRYSGFSRDGRPLAEALQSPLVGVRLGLKEGKTPEEALRLGLQRATRTVGIDLDHAHRTALTDTIDADERFSGWERVTAGTCGACMALSGTSGPRFESHPGCSCTPQPTVTGVPNRIPVLQAAALFERMSREEQDAAVGPAVADALRAGDLDFGALVKRNRIRQGDDFITQAPADPA